MSREPNPAPAVVVKAQASARIKVTPPREAVIFWG
jgi:hypothetical protein